MIPIFIPHVGCPHICVFCNQRRIANTVEIPTGETVKKMISEYTGIKDWIEQENKENNWEVAFYGGSFTAIDKKMQEELLTPAKEALDKGIISAIRCSTRPDALEKENIDLIKKFGMKTVEIGVQSLNDEVLEKSQRGHTANDVKKAVKRLKEHNINVGIQLMPGLPGDTLETIAKTTKDVIELEPNFVRIYPVLVIEETTLGDDYRAGKYIPLEKQKALEICAKMKRAFDLAKIDVIRIGLQATETLDNGESLLAGPYSPSFGEEAINEQVYQQITEYLDNLTSLPIEIKVKYPRKITSKVRGLKNSVKNRLEKKYLLKWHWQEDNSIAENTYIIETNYGEKEQFI